MNIGLVFWVFALVLFLCLLGLEVLGCRRGARRLELDPSGTRVSAIEGSIFGLLGLLIAFTFSGAATRFELRRQQIVAETNAVGTAWLRLDLLPAERRGGVRDSMRAYVDARLEGHRRLPDIDAAQESFARASELQGAIWSGALAACAETEGPQATMLVLTALNQMFDIAGERVAAMRMHTPYLIYGLLVLLSLCCAFLAGFAIAKAKAPSWTYMLAFAAVLTFTVYAIVDLELPRAGIIRLDATDQLLMNMRRSMEEPR